MKFCNTSKYIYNYIAYLAKYVLIFKMAVERFQYMAINAEVLEKTNNNIFSMNQMDFKLLAFLVASRMSRLSLMRFSLLSHKNLAKTTYHYYSLT